MDGRRAWRRRANLGATGISDRLALSERRELRLEDPPVALRFKMRDTNGDRGSDAGQYAVCFGRQADFVVGGMYGMAEKLSDVPVVKLEIDIRAIECDVDFAPGKTHQRTEVPVTRVQREIDFSLESLLQGQLVGLARDLFLNASRAVGRLDDLHTQRFVALYAGCMCVVGSFLYFEELFVEKYSDHFTHRT